MRSSDEDFVFTSTWVFPSPLLGSRSLEESGDIALVANPPAAVGLWAGHTGLVPSSPGGVRAAPGTKWATSYSDSKSLSGGADWPICFQGAVTYSLQPAPLNVLSRNLRCSSERPHLSRIATWPWNFATGGGRAAVSISSLLAVLVLSADAADDTLCLTP